MAVPPKLYRMEREARDVSLDTIYDYIRSVSARQLRQANRLQELAIAQEQLAAKLDRIIELLEDR
jgi:hypothetical protein